MLKLADIKDNDTATIEEIKRGAADGLEGGPQGEATPGYLTGYYMAAFAREANNKTQAVQSMEYDLTTGEVKAKRVKVKKYTASNSTYLASDQRVEKSIDALEDMRKSLNQIVFEQEKEQALAAVDKAKAELQDLYAKQLLRMKKPLPKSGTYKSKDSDENVKKVVEKAQEEAQTRQKKGKGKEAKSKSFGVGSPLGLLPSRLPGASLEADKRVEKSMKAVKDAKEKYQSDARITLHNTDDESNGPAKTQCLVVNYKGEDDATGESIIECIDPYCEFHDDDDPYENLMQTKALPAAKDDFACYDCEEPVPHFISESSLLGHIASVHLGEDDGSSA